MQSGKLDLYEEYRQGKISREKFMVTQEKRQREADRLNDELTKLEEQFETLKKKSERMEKMTEDAKDLRMLSEYRPEVIRRLISKIRVYGNGRIEIDLLSNDDFILDILESIRQMAG